jgi:hypothetical protein
MFQSLKRQKTQEADQTYQFDPIMESVVQFLEFRDCAQVSMLDKEFDSRMWLHVLRSWTRDVNSWVKIKVCAKSMPWIVRYAAELKYINLIIRETPQVDIDFEGLGVTEVASLSIWWCTIRNLQLPSQLRHLDLSDTIWRAGVRIPHTLTRFQICNRTINVSITNILGSLPRGTLERLYILDCKFHLASSPMFPHVKKVCWRTDNKNALQGIQTKFPSLRRLDIEHDTIDLMPLIGSQITKLRIASINLCDLTPLRNIPITRLDVRDCPSIVNFDAVRHVSTLIKFDK